MLGVKDTVGTRNIQGIVGKGSIFCCVNGNLASDYFWASGRSASVEIWTIFDIFAGF